MFVKYSFIVIYLLLVNHGLGDKSSLGGCKISNWVRLNMIELLTLSRVVVLGRETNNLTLFQNVYSSFEVFCVLKDDGQDVHENITIFAVSPPSKCSGTAGQYSQGEQVILGLRRISNNTFQWDEHVPVTSIAFPVKFDNLLQISSTCDLQSWRKPVGAARDNCPLCSNDQIFVNQNISEPMNVICFADTMNVDNCTFVQRATTDAICECPEVKINVGDGNGTIRHGENIAVVLIAIAAAFMVV